MTDLRTAAQQALNALINLQPIIANGLLDNHQLAFIDPHLDIAIEALQEGLAQEQPNPPGCDHCNHPLYAATKCRVCGRVTEPEAEPTYKTYPIRMHFEWVGDRWLFDDNPIDSGEWCVTLGNNGWMIYPKVEQAEPKVTMLVDPRDPQRAYMAQVDTQNYREAWTMQTSPSPEAEPVQEPVGYWEGEFSRDGGAMLYEVPQQSAFGFKYRNEPLYTAPPQRKPLTEEEIDDLSREMVKSGKSVNWLCRAVERKLKEKNRGQ